MDIDSLRLKSFENSIQGEIDQLFVNKNIVLNIKFECINDKKCFNFYLFSESPLSEDFFLKLIEWYLMLFQAILIDYINNCDNITIINKNNNNNSNFWDNQINYKYDGMFLWKKPHLESVDNNNNNDNDNVESEKFKVSSESYDFSGCSGCLVLIGLVFLLFKGCVALFPSDSNTYTPLDNGVLAPSNSDTLAPSDSGVSSPLDNGASSTSTSDSGVSSSSDSCLTMSQKHSANAEILMNTDPLSEGYMEKQKEQNEVADYILENCK